MNAVVLDVESCGRVDAPEEIASALRLGAKLAVVDLVFDRELRGRGGERLLRRGLCVESLADIRPALALRNEHPCLSLGDAFTLALAETLGCALLTDTAALARLALGRGIPVRSPEWLASPYARPAHVSELRSRYGLML